MKASCCQDHNVQPSGRVGALFFRFPTLLGLAGLSCSLIGQDPFYSCIAVSDWLRVLVLLYRILVSSYFRSLN